MPKEITETPPAKRPRADGPSSSQSFDQMLVLYSSLSDDEKRKFFAVLQQQTATHTDPRPQARQELDGERSESISHSESGAAAAGLEHRQSSGSTHIHDAVREESSNPVIIDWRFEDIATDKFNPIFTIGAKRPSVPGQSGKQGDHTTPYTAFIEILLKGLTDDKEEGGSRLADAIDRLASIAKGLQPDKHEKYDSILSAKHKAMSRDGQREILERVFTGKEAESEDRKTVRRNIKIARIAIYSDIIKEISSEFLHDMQQDRFASFSRIGRFDPTKGEGSDIQQNMDVLSALDTDRALTIERTRLGSTTLSQIEKAATAMSDLLGCNYRDHHNHVKTPEELSHICARHLVAMFNAFPKLGADGQREMIAEKFCEQMIDGKGWGQ